MKERLGAVLALAFVLAAFGAQGARADCFTPLATHDKWTCTGELSTGAVGSYCLNLTTTTGEGASRTFTMVTPGPYPRTCSCGAKAAGRNVVYNAANSYFCLDASTDTVEAGTITKRKLVGQIYNVSQDVRGTFTCTPDPACVVP